jgi:hypothetical protein
MSQEHFRDHPAMPLYNDIMYIIAIGWLYVTVLMAFTETSVIAGLLSFIFYGLAPTALLYWLLGTKTRRKRSAALAANQLADTPDRSDAQADQ